MSNSRRTSRGYLGTVLDKEGYRYDFEISMLGEKLETGGIQNFRRFWVRTYE